MIKKNACRSVSGIGHLGLGLGHRTKSGEIRVLPGWETPVSVYPVWVVLGLSLSHRRND